MNWLELSDNEIMKLVTPIMNNLMDASSEIDHEKHVRDFSENMKNIVTKEELEKQCKIYQKTLGFFTKRELVGIFKKKGDVRVFWKQWYSKSDDEFLAFVHIVQRNGKLEVVNASVS
ncbi:hypothetical protein [Pseudoalteromonas sp. S16_S37]|uniref:hypothetical protein n=1 Tax=Pseudoalteromonas sp. S16_S37 TaxID=2720228 RepID=UPI001680FDDD|nr:hypothetical protein [Pseudoalteromonas sp. S16_S37]